MNENNQTVKSEFTPEQWEQFNTAWDFINDEIHGLNHALHSGELNKPDYDRVATTLIEFLPTVEYCLKQQRFEDLMDEISLVSGMFELAKGGSSKWQS